MRKFEGLIPPMVTPLDERRRLDKTGVKNMVRHLVDGGVCTGANLWPRAFKEMYLAAKAGDAEKVRRLQRFTTMSSYLLYGLGAGQIGFLKGVKAALAEMGLIQNVLAAPFAPFSGKELAPVKAAIRKLKAETNI